jgi:glutaredoxin
MRLVCCLITLICLVSTAGARNAAIYKWVDKNGTVTYQDTPPPKGTEVKVYEPKGLATVEYRSNKTVVEEIQKTLPDGVDNAAEYFTKTKRQVTDKRTRKSFPKVELFVTSWCGYCVKAKSFLQSKGVPFKAYDVEKNSQAAKQHRKLNPSGSVPVALIGGRTIRGFSPEIYGQALGL